jgi:hypothetical protein
MASEDLKSSEGGPSKDNEGKNENIIDFRDK